MCFGDVLEDISDYIVNANFSRTLRTTYFIKKSFDSISDPENSVDGTWMTKEELEEHLDYPKRYLGIDYDFEVTDISNEYQVVIEFHSDTIHTLATAKLVLFWFRYAFEYPYNLFIIDAYLLKEKLEYKDWSLISLVQLTNQAFPGYNANFPPEYPVADIKPLLENLSGNTNIYRLLNEWFQYASVKRNDYSKRIRVSENLTQKYNLRLFDCNRDGDYISNAGNYLKNNNRFGIYKELYDELW